MESIIAIIGSFLLGITALLRFWGKVSQVLKAVKEVLDLPAAVGEVAQKIDAGIADKQLTEQEIQEIYAGIKNVKTQFDEAKAAIEGLTFLGKKVVK